MAADENADLLDKASWTFSKPFDPETLTGKVLALPTREDIDSQIAEHMIVELYSK